MNWCKVEPFFSAGKNHGQDVGEILFRVKVVMRVTTFRFFVAVVENLKLYNARKAFAVIYCIVLCNSKTRLSVAGEEAQVGPVQMRFE